MSFQYVKNPYLNQPTVYSNLDSLKHRLCCPIVWTWIIFFLRLPIFIYPLCIPFDLLNVIVPGICLILYFLIAFLVTRSGQTGDVKKYKAALFICIVIFSIVSIFLIICFIFGKAAKKQFNFSYDDDSMVILIVTLILYLVGLELITIIVLCCYLKEFNMVLMPDNHQLLDPQI